MAKTSNNKGRMESLILSSSPSLIIYVCAPRRCLNMLRPQKTFPIVVFASISNQEKYLYVHNTFMFSLFFDNILFSLCFLFEMTNKHHTHTITITHEFEPGSRIPHGKLPRKSTIRDSLSLFKRVAKCMCA